jgi:hypothetical protein
MRMPFLALTVLSPLLLAPAACGYNSPPPRGIEESVTSAISAEDESVILLTVEDPLPVKSARLIDPSGAVTEAFAIDTDRQSYGGGSGVQPNVGVGVVGGSSSGVSTGIGIGFPIFSSNGGAVRRLTESRARIRIADLAAYRRDWQRYAIAVELDDGVNRRAFEMVPPAPR